MRSTHLARPVPPRRRRQRPSEDQKVAPDDSAILLPEPKDRCQGQDSEDRGSERPADYGEQSGPESRGEHVMRHTGLGKRVGKGHRGGQGRRDGGQRAQGNGHDVARAPADDQEHGAEGQERDIEDGAEQIEARYIGPVQPTVTPRKNAHVAMANMVMPIP